VETQTGQKSITLRGREFIRDVVCAVKAAAGGGTLGQVAEYNVLSSLVSPTDSNMFSWLTQIAAKFEEYKFHGLAFTYEPQCTSLTTGVVGVYFDGDPQNSPPASWQTFTNTGCNTHGANWAKHQLIIPRRYYADRKVYYTKDQFDDAAPGKGAEIDPLEYFIGSIGTATVGVTGNGAAADFPAGSVQYFTVGKIYMDYAITLSKATLDTTPRTSPQYPHSAAQAVVPAGVAPTKTLVSPYFAGLSGTGLFVRPQVYQASTVATPIFGTVALGALDVNTAADIAPSSKAPLMYGDQYFLYNANVPGNTASGTVSVSNCIAKQTVDLMITACMGTCTSVAISMHFENSDNKQSTLSAWRRMPTVPSGSYNESVVCHIQAGERVSLVVTCLTGSSVSTATSFITLSPWCWGLEQ